MSKLERIQSSIATLDPRELAKLREWLIEFEERAFDARIERDVKAGNLDPLITEALANLDAGRGEGAGF
jgi:hypothetical protein